MKNFFETHGLNLQLFAEGASGGSGVSGVGASTGAQTADAGQSSGVKDGSAAVATEGTEDARGAAEQGDQGEQKASGDDRRAAYAKLKAEYQDLYDEDVQGIVRNRVRENKAEKKATMALLDQLAVRYGTEPGDLKGLKAAMDADKLYLSAKAEETGTTEEVQAELEKYRTRDATEKREAREVESARRAAELTAQTKAVKELYPFFDVKTEMRNPEFVKLLDDGYGLRKAYEIAHWDEIRQAEAQYVAREAARRSKQKAEDDLVANIRANGMRPSENAAKGAAPAQAKVDPSKFTKDQFDEYIRRARNGERITF